MAQTRKLIVVGGLLLISGVLFAPAAIGHFLGNLGWLAFRDQMIAQGRRLTDYPLYRVIDQSSIQVSQDWLERAHGRQRRIGAVLAGRRMAWRQARLRRLSVACTADPGDSV
jgi:hypothetical protein